MEQATARMLQLAGTLKHRASQRGQAQSSPKAQQQRQQVQQPQVKWACFIFFWIFGVEKQRSTAAQRRGHRPRPGDVAVYRI